MAAVKSSFSHSMPVNIALTKYIGKQDSDAFEGINQALHPTLSYLLPELYTVVTLTYDPCLSKDIWLTKPGVPKLSHYEIMRFLSHLSYVKGQLGFEGCFTVESRNNFPRSAGLASSSSSFAALTACAVKAIESVDARQDSLKLSKKSIALLSRGGSGSSCRSFYGPWCLWDQEHLEPLSFDTWDRLQHAVLMFSSEQKHISSSKAHHFVRTSPYFEQRQENVLKRNISLRKALHGKDWQTTYHLVWADFIEMHRLFHTSQPSFTYCTPLIRRSLEFLQAWWSNNGDGPLITMDAGSNIHLLFRPDQKYERDRLLRQFADVPILYGTACEDASIQNA